MNNIFKTSNYFLLIICFSFSISANENNPSVKIENITINGIRINDFENEIYKIIGKPIKTIINNNSFTNDERKTIYYSGLKIFLIYGEIYNLSCTNQTCVTEKGVRIGDTRKKVESLYGSIPMKNKNNSLMYPFKKNGKYTDKFLVFRFKNNKVIKMVYFFDYT